MIFHFFAVEFTDLSFGSVCSVRLFVGQVMGGFNPHQPPPEYATAAVSKAGRHMHMQRTQDRSGGRGEGFATLLHG